MVSSVWCFSVISTVCMCVNLIFNAVFQTQSTSYSSTLLLFGSLASDCDADRLKFIIKQPEDIFSRNVLKNKQVCLIK